MRKNPVLKKTQERPVPFVLLAPLFAAVLLFVSSPWLHAFDCRDWKRPFVTDLNIFLMKDTRKEQLDPSKTFRIEPGAFVLQVVCMDQYGREFPSDQTSIRVFVTKSAGQEPEVSPLEYNRFQVRVSDEVRSFTLRFTMPGNRNLDTEISMDATRPRTKGISQHTILKRYSQKEAEAIARGLYVGLLGREPDNQGFNYHTNRILNGDLDAVIQDFVKGQEFKKNREGLGSERLLDDLYQGFLGRPIDPSGKSGFLGDMMHFNYSKVIHSIINSQEFQDRVGSGNRGRFGRSDNR
jgi:hypothetical protein